jgi:DNA-binding NarL/FixJ family response regulator
MPKRIVLIEDNLDARRFLCDHAPDDWEILEADNGLTGLDLVREWLTTLDLVILDMLLPDVDGEYLCAQIRELSSTLPILPYTGKETALPVLHDLACLPPLVKPVDSARLRATLAGALDRPAPAIVESGALRFVRTESYRVVQEQRAAMSGRRIVVMATDEYMRTWLSQMISPVITPIRAENLPALRKILTTLNVTAVVGDAAIADAIAPITQPYGVPLILVATTPTQARGLGTDADIHSLFLSSDAKLGTKLRATIDGLDDAEGAGDWLLDDSTDTRDDGVVPADILRCFANTRLTMRQIQVLWLEHQGLDRSEIASRLGITVETVSSHWKHAQAKIGVEAKGRKAWIAAQICTGSG